MEFPVEIVSMIKEFSMPITRPDWRTLHHMPNHMFYYFVARSFNEHMHQCLYELALQDEYHYQIHFYNGMPYIEYFY